MNLLDIVCGPWLITPERHEVILGIYDRHLGGEKLDWNAMAKELGRPAKHEPKPYTVEGDGVAVVSIDGVLSKRMNLFSQISGGTSYQKIASDIEAAVEDPSVRSIILAIDSPGGAVDGCQELGDVIHSVRGKKPIVAVADGQMCSAAYWLGSAADQIFMTSDTTVVGSIGVVATHKDVSSAEERAGVKTTEITAGKYKRIASSYAPLSKEGRASIQDQVDQIYGSFVGTVAKNRGVTKDVVLDKMADGRVFIGQQAIDAGLVDGVSTIPQMIRKLSGGNTAFGGLAAVSAETQTQEETMEVTVEKIAAEFPDIAEHFRAEGRAQGATSERERIQAVEAQSMPGFEAEIQTMKFDGKTTGPEAAVVVLSKVRAQNAGALAALAEDAPPALPASPAAEAHASTQENDANKAARQGWLARQKIQAAQSRGITMSIEEALAEVEKEETR